MNLPVLCHLSDIGVYDRGDNNYSILIGICVYSVDKLHLACLISQFMTEFKGHLPPLFTFSEKHVVM